MRITTYVDDEHDEKKSLTIISLPELSSKDPFVMWYVVGVLEAKSNWMFIY